MRPDASGLHLTAEKTGHGLHELLLALAELGRAVLQQEHHAAHEIALGDDRRGHADVIPVGGVGRMQQHVAGLMAVAAAQFHQLLELLRAALVGQLALRHAVDGDDRVAVADRGDMPGVFADRLADLPGELAEIAHRGIFFKDDLAVLLRIDLQRVALADTQCAADLLGDDDAAEVV